MRFVQHPSNNNVLEPPKNKPSDFDVGALPVTLAEIDGRKAIVSFWKPDADEMRNLLKGKPVMLIVYDTRHPVVAMGVEP